MTEKIESKKIIVPAEKLAAAVEKHLLPGLLKYLNEQQRLDRKSGILKNEE